MPDTTPERDRAQSVQQHYAAAVKQLHEDRDLTDDARRRRHAEAWTAARRELDEIQAAEKKRLAGREQELERRLFGLSTLGADSATQAISARDAQDRASRLTRPQDAAELLRRAEQNGDQSLARAIAHHALEQGRAAMTRDVEGAWDQVLGTFLEARPHMTPIVEELAMIERLGKRQVLGPFSLAQPPGVSSADINAARVPA